ncbi:hypothetical protein, partial [Frankia sp. AgKG'84/4]|uniref:hypothetical protein n=1 Tax=Frankia sp. AgKG'84/4 TaxID=573490 RepID=UPI00202AB530
ARRHRAAPATTADRPSAVFSDIGRRAPGHVSGTVREFDVWRAEGEFCDDGVTGSPDEPPAGTKGVRRVPIPAPEDDYQAILDTVDQRRSGRG